LARGRWGATRSGPRLDLAPVGPIPRSGSDVAVRYGVGAGLSDLAACGVAGLATVVLAIGVAVPTEATAAVATTAALLLAVKVVAVSSSSLHPRLRQALLDPRTVAVSVALVAAVATVGLYLGGGGRSVPLAVPLLDGMLTTVLVLGGRGVVRYLRRRRST
jgi:FlaA1/EpsC-like NDP-sugar epimerase